MSVSWEVVVSPITFEPVYALKLNGRHVFTIAVAEIQDKVYDEYEFMQLLLQIDSLTDDEIATGLKSFRDKFYT